MISVKIIAGMVQKTVGIYLSEQGKCYINDTWISSIFCSLLGTANMSYRFELYSVLHLNYSL